MCLASSSSVYFDVEVTRNATGSVPNDDGNIPQVPWWVSLGTDQEERQCVAAVPGSWPIPCNRRPSWHRQCVCLVTVVGVSR